jgi:predicted ATPase
MTNDSVAESKFKWENRVTSLRNWRLGSFKSVNQPIDVELAPLTVVVGANSSGKSTLIQSILLMAQNASRVDEKNTAKARGLFELNGPLVQLGTFRETACDLIESSNPFFKFGGNWFAGERAFGLNTRQALLRVGDHSLNWDISLRPLDKNLDSGVALIDSAEVDYIRKEELLSSAEVMFKESKANTELLRSKYENFSFRHNAMFEARNPIEEQKNFKKQRLQAVSFQAGLPSTGLFSKNIVDYMFEKQGKVFNELMFMGESGDPFEEEEHVATQYASVEAVIDAFVQELADFGKRILQQDRASEDRSVGALSQKIEKVLLVPSELFPDSARSFFGDLDPENSSGSKAKAADSFALKFMRDLRKKFDELHGDAEWAQESTYLLPDGKRSAQVINSTSNHLQRAVRGWNRYLAESVLYLGPLRVGPRATYGLGASVENSNIPLGESGEFLAKRMFIDDTPKAYPIVENGKLKDARFTLEQAVTFWYNELTSNGEQNGINVDAPNRQGYPLKIGKRTLANVGFGASQILPVLGLCLSAVPGDLVLLEQPELHLNPGMQQKLADFLLTMAKTGRQIIVETHSEYLITRLRRSAATDVDDHKYFTIIFVERNPLTGTSYRTVSVDDQGDLSEWPRGFFDHVAEDLRILMRKAAERQSVNARPDSGSIEE